MRQLYYFLVMTIIWLSLLFNLEWLVDSFTLAPFLYVFIPACSVFVILGLKRRKLSLPSLLLIGLAAYAVFEYLFDVRMGTANLTTVSIGLSAVVITILLSSLIGKRMANLQAMLTSLVVGPAHQNEQAFADAQGLLYREVRARATLSSRTCCVSDFATQSACQCVACAHSRRTVSDARD